MYYVVIKCLIIHICFLDNMDIFREYEITCEMLKALIFVM